MSFDAYLKDLRSPKDPSKGELVDLGPRAQRVFDEAHEIPSKPRRGARIRRFFDRYRRVKPVELSVVPDDPYDDLWLGKRVPWGKEQDYLKGDD